MERRKLLGLGVGALLSAASRSQQVEGHVTDFHELGAIATELHSRADITLRIERIPVELSPNRIISTVGYNGMCPGPILRMREGSPVAVDVVNMTEQPELVHWHGLLIPPEVDGAEEEGTPAVPPNSRRRYAFVPRPAGTRWYHSHAMAGEDLHRGTYSGQFGFLLVEGKRNELNYDQEVFLALHDWEPFYVSREHEEDDEQEEVGISGSQPERPKILDRRSNGLEVTSQIFSINDKMLGAGEPIRVKGGQRLLIHLLNASAIEVRRLALPGHRFQVLALDGNAVPSPRSVGTIIIGPGERVDCYVDMNQPGVWILGAADDTVREAGMGVVIEYAGQRYVPRWVEPGRSDWDYTLFGRPNYIGEKAPNPERTIDLVFERIPSGDGKFNLWLVNGKPFPHEREFVLNKGIRHRLVFRNRSDDAHPVHIHRHQFEIVEINGTPTSGVIKDTVIVPFYGRVSVDLLADQPGLTLFHCHVQHHMDHGFKALFRYA